MTSTNAVSTTLYLEKMKVRVLSSKYRSTACPSLQYVSTDRAHAIRKER